MNSVLINKFKLNFKHIFVYIVENFHYLNLFSQNKFNKISSKIFIHLYMFFYGFVELSPIEQNQK